MAVLQSVSWIWTNEARLLFLSQFLTTFEESVIFEAAGAVSKISLCLKPCHHKQIQLAQIGETLCSIYGSEYFRNVSPAFCDGNL